MKQAACGGRPASNAPTERIVVKSSVTEGLDLHPSDRWNQTSDEFEREVAALNATLYEELITGKRQPIVMSRIDCSRTGVITSRRRKRSSAVVTRRVLAVGRSTRCTARVRVAWARGRRERPPGCRRTAAVPRAGPDDLDAPPQAARSGLRHIREILVDQGFGNLAMDEGASASSSSCGADDGGSDDTAEGVDDGGFSDDEARYVAEHVVELWPAGLTVRRFDATVWPFLFGLPVDVERDAKERIYAALPHRLRASMLEGDSAVDRDGGAS